jgi:hypothetical protein
MLTAFTAFIIKAAISAVGLCNDREGSVHWACIRIHDWVSSLAAWCPEPDVHPIVYYLYISQLNLVINEENTTV